MPYSRYGSDAQSRLSSMVTPRDFSRFNWQFVYRYYKSVKTWVIPCKISVTKIRLCCRLFLWLHITDKSYETGRARLWLFL